MTTKAKATNYDEIRERAAEAKADLDRIEAELEADRRREQELRGERLEAWDAAFVDNYDAEALLAEEEAAWQAFYGSVADENSPWRRLVEAWAWRDRRIQLSMRARAAAEALGRTPLPAEIQYRQRDVVSAIGEALRRAVEQLVGEDEVTLDNERRMAAEGSE